MREICRGITAYVPLVNATMGYAFFITFVSKLYTIMGLATTKQEIIQWINSIEDPDVIEQINHFRKQKPFRFEEEIENAISWEELKNAQPGFFRL